MEINRYFSGEPERDLPRRVYARSVDFMAETYEHFDALDADFLDRAASESPEIFEPVVYAEFIQKAPILGIEVRASPVFDDTYEHPWGLAADVWLDRRNTRGEWMELTIERDPEGAAEVFLSAAAPGLRARIRGRNLPKNMSHALKRATSLARFRARADELEESLPADAIAGVVVLDVGQGSSAALIGGEDQVIGYVDIGAGIRNDRATWPSAMGDFCVAHPPVVILSHWHEDHFHGANKTPSTRSLTWIAPDQPLGPGPQTAMASAIGSTGKLLVWSGRGSRLRRGQLTLERCRGTGQNRSGIAVWVDHPSWNEHPWAMEPILLPGDAAYLDILGLKGSRPRPVHSFVVAHHGGQSVGFPPARRNVPFPRAAFSYGAGNSYGHPLPRSIAGLRASAWSVGPRHQRGDDLRTENRHIGQVNLGHIGLDWGAGQLKVGCNCGCTLSPTQF